MADLYPNINPNIKDERGKHQLVKDEALIATAAGAVVRGQPVQMNTPAGGGIPTCQTAAAGAEAYAVMEDAAAGALVRVRMIGHAPFRTTTAMATGTRVMAGGANFWIAHVAGAGNYYGGRLQDASSGVANHIVSAWVERGEA